MYDEDLRSARQALGDGRWEEARSFYASFSPQKVAEARPALLLIDLHEAREAKDTGFAEKIAGQLSECLLEQMGELPGEFIRAFCPQVFPNLLPVKTFSVTYEVRVKQWLLSAVARNIVLNYCTTDEMASLSEPEQHRLCRVAVDLHEYVFLRGGFHIKEPDEFTNRHAASNTFERFLELSYDKDMWNKMKQVYRALGMTDASEMPITPEEIEQYKKAEKRGIAVLLFLLLLVCVWGVIWTKTVFFP